MRKMEVRFVSGDYGEILNSEGWFKRFGHKGIEVGDEFYVQLNVSRPYYFQLSEGKNKKIHLIDADVPVYNFPLYYFSGEIIKLGRYMFKREMWEKEDGKTKLARQIDIIRTIMMVDCGIPIRVIIEYWPNTYQEGDYVIFEGGLGGTLCSDPEPIVMLVRGRVKEKIERKDQVYVVFETKSTGELKVIKDYPFWVKE